MAVRSLRIVVLVIVAFAAGLLLARLIAPSKVEPPQTERATVFPAPRAVPALNLVDQDGKPLDPDFFKGHWTLVFFGFTQCPDVCPTSMSTMAEVKRLLGKQGSLLQVLFVTVDPERDTLPLLKEYMLNFDATFLALRPEPDQLKELSESFKMYYKKVEGKTPTSYSMDHSAGKYIFDAKGSIRLFSKYGAEPQAIAQDIQNLL